MTERFRNKYRVKTTRLGGYDYRRKGSYFITICTLKKVPYFGVIFNGEINLSETGIIVEKFWLEIPDHYPNIQLDKFIIMPDHIHGIIIINSNARPNSEDTPVETPNLGVSITKKSGNLYWRSNSIGSIINQFKRICTIKTRSQGLDLTWQPRYYDRIIRSDNELDSIRTYIINNPDNWLIDGN